MADNYEIDLEIEGGEQPDLVMNVQGGEQPELNLQTEGGATDGASARNAEAWANGTRNGVPVTEGDPAYHNNSKYYRDSAAAIVAGDIIDDDAGIGDHDLTWSADKLVGEFEGKATAIGVTDTESAAVKTIPDGADGMPIELTVGIEPVQNLHGYGNPWPGGSGKNLIPDGTDTNNGYVNSSILTNDGGTTSNGSLYVSEYFPVVANTEYSFSSTVKLNAPSVCFYDSSKAYISGVNFNNNLTIQVTTPANAVYARATQYKNINNGIIQFELGSATDIKPYSNICPISGWDAVTIKQRNGTDHFENEGFTRNSSSKFTVAYPDDHTIEMKAVSGAYVDYGRVYKSLSGFNLAPGKKYTVKATVSYTKNSPKKLMGVSSTTLSDGFVASADFANGDADSFSFIYDPETCLYIVFFMTWSTSVKDREITYSDIEFFEGDVAIDYPITIPSTPGTVYGASLTVNKDGTGKLVVDCVKHDLPTTGWDKLVSGANIYSRARNSAWDEIPKSYSSGAKQLCDCLIPTNSISSASHTPWTVAIYNANNNYLRICFPDDDESFDTKEEAMAWIAANAPYVVYEVETPITYDLTAEQVNALITSLKGVNNIFCDAGDILSVDYSADTKLYVDGKISEGMKLIALLLTANNENGMKASKAYASGDLLTVGNTLYKATTSIANGATLTAGTNVTETTIAQELAALA